MSELHLVAEEALEELEALKKLVNFSSLGRLGGRPLSNRSKLVASDAAILFIAAAFEEAVRQLGVVYAELVVAHGDIPETRLRSMKIGLWEKASAQLNNKPYGSKNFDASQARLNLAIISEFCLNESNLSILISHGIYNDRNLKSGELNALFKRLGLSDICSKVGRSEPFRAFFSVGTLNEAQVEFRKFLDKFYRDRNSATHDLSSFRAMGPVDVARNIEFFKTTTKRISEVLVEDLTSLRGN